MVDLALARFLKGEVSDFSNGPPEDSQSDLGMLSSASLGTSSRPASDTDGGKDRGSEHQVWELPPSYSPCSSGTTIPPPPSVGLIPSGSSAPSNSGASAASNTLLGGSLAPGGPGAQEVPTKRLFLDLQHFAEEDSAAEGAPMQAQASAGSSESTRRNRALGWEAATAAATESGVPAAGSSPTRTLGDLVGAGSVKALKIWQRPIFLPPGREDGSSGSSRIEISLGSLSMSDSSGGFSANCEGGSRGSDFFNIAETSRGSQGANRVSDLFNIADASRNSQESNEHRTTLREFREAFIRQQHPSASAPSRPPTASMGSYTFEDEFLRPLPNTSSIASNLSMSKEVLTAEARTTVWQWCGACASTVAGEASTEIHDGLAHHFDMWGNSPKKEKARIRMSM